MPDSRRPSAGAGVHGDSESVVQESAARPIAKGWRDETIAVNVRQYSSAPYRRVHAALGLVHAGSGRRVACDDESRPWRTMTDAAPSAECLSRPGWQACVRADRLVLSLHGDWSVRGEGAHARTPDRLLEHPDIRVVAFDASDLGSWDSSLLIFLSFLREASALRRVDFDESGLPAATRRLLALLRTEPRSPPATGAHIGVAERVGDWAL